MNGVLIVNKDAGLTSRDIVNELVKVFNTKKIGHTGTLDPLATGVLVCTIGRYTKLNELLTSTFKEYIAEMKLGISTDTLDITGNILEEKEIDINNKDIINTINSFKGKYIQEVPLYSAVKVNGKKLYEYARENISVELPKKEVEIKNIEVLDINNNIVKFRCLVSKGTYIRSLIRDIGNKLNIPTSMNSLIRTKQGIFNIEDSFTVDDIKNNKYKLLSIEDILDVDVIELTKEQKKQVINGNKIEIDCNKEYILFKESNKEIALYKKEEDFYKVYLMIEVNI